MSIGLNEIWDGKVTADEMDLAELSLKQKGKTRMVSKIFILDACWQIWIDNEGR